MSDFVSGRGFASQDRSGPSQAEIARLEYEASLKRNETKTKSSHIPFRPSVPNTPHDPFRIGSKAWNRYDTDERMTRIHGSVTRIRDEMKRITIQFKTITEPNRSQRRAFAAIMKRLHHAIDSMPGR